jgi:hypothetical protein
MSLMSVSFGRVLNLKFALSRLNRNIARQEKLLQLNAISIGARDECDRLYCSYFQLPTDTEKLLQLSAIATFFGGYSRLTLLKSESYQIRFFKLCIQPSPPTPLLSLGEGLVVRETWFY